MPRKVTPKAPPRESIFQPAIGLHNPATAKVYYFDQFLASDKTPKLRLRIGRSPKCDIRLMDKHTSYFHADLLRQANGHMMIVPLASATNELYADNYKVIQPTLITVGMHIELCYALLIGVGKGGRFPIAAKTADEYLRNAGDLYGSNSLAGKRICRSRETIRQRRTGSRTDSCGEE